MSRDSDRWMNSGGGGYTSAPKKKKESKTTFGKHQLRKIEANEKKHGPRLEAERAAQENALTSTAQKQRLSAQAQGHQYAKNFLNEDTQGLTPQQRSAMQYEAERQIDRGQQTANRKLLGDQSQRGIVGRGGVGYAQQRDLAQRAQEARGGVHRDLDKLNADLAMKKKAAEFAIAQGEVGAQGLEREAAVDSLAMQEERKKQRANEYAASHRFNRV